MRYDLATMARRLNPGRRKPITFRDAPPPAMLAQSLFARAYKPVLERWQAAIPGILAEYERTLSGLTHDTADDLQARLDAASSELDRLFILIDASLRDWGLQAETWTRDSWRGAVLSATGVDLQTLIGPADVRETLAAAIQWNTSLVRDVSAQIRQKISNSVFSGLTQRKPAREVAKEINEATAFGRARSLRIASDQLAKLSGSLAEERQRQAGITQVEWKSSHKLHARPWHAARDGVVYDIETHAPVDGGDPVPAGDWVAQAPFCGCRTRARLIFD